VLSYRRRNAVLQTLASIEAPSYIPREIIVVDNNSDDGTVECIQARFPDVHVLRLPRNEGTVARNYGVKAAKGEIVVTLDNDVHFSSPFELDRIASAFSAHSDASCITFKVLEADKDKLAVCAWCHPYPYWKYSDSVFQTDYIAEGACAFRRQAFLDTGGYWGPLWIGHEGWDLALQLLDHGGHILYDPSIQVRHMQSLQARPSHRPFYYYTRNYLWIAARNYRLLGALRYLGQKLPMMAWFSARTKNLRAFGSGLRDGLVGLPAALKARRTLSPTVWKTLKALECNRPGIMSRLRRHRERPLL
jgi:GT2 family glycosyltransferase